MKRREFLARLGTAGTLSLGAGLCGCIDSDSGEDGVTSTGTATATPTTGSVDSVSLAGTCPRGKSCRSPECQLWTDLNGDDACDRGR